MTVGGSWAQVRLQVAFIFGLTLVTIVMRFLWRHFFFTGARLAEVEMRQRLLAHALALPAGHYSKTRTGELMALATSDLQAVRLSLAMGLVAGFDATVFALVALVALVLLDWRLALWTALPFPVLGVVMRFALRSIYQRWDAVQSAFERLTEKVRESLAGMRVLRAYVQEEGDQADFERYNADAYQAQMAYVRVDALYQPAIAVLTGASTALLLGVGGARVARGELTLGGFTAFSAYLAMLSWPMIAAGWTFSLMQRGAASMARLLEFLEAPAETESVGTGPLTDGAIEARGLTFTYPGADRPALHDVSFRLAPGESLGLVGEVGSGKSTLALLLSRVYDPPRGTLFVDGVDVNDLPLAHLRRMVSLVPQEPFLFSATIAENLRLADSDADDAALVDACRSASVHDDVTAFPDGYDTLLGERGVTLSGGQRQRVCLARALLKRSPVLVLDDTLSAVDADTESRILGQLESGLQDTRRTSVVVAHRISAVRNATHILVLREGGVVQSGRHDALVAQEGSYRELYTLQALASVGASASGDARR